MRELKAREYLFDLREEFSSDAFFLILYFERAVIKASAIVSIVFSFLGA